MLIFRILLYLFFAGAAWLVRSIYIGWLGPYLFLAVVLIPPLMLLISLPSILKLEIQLQSDSRVMRGSDAKLTIDFTNHRWLPVHSVTVHLEIENRFTGEVSRQNYLFRNLVSSQSEIPFSTAECGEIRCRLLRFECTDAIGLFAIRRKSHSETRSTVMPSAVESDRPVNFEASFHTSPVLVPKYGGGYAEEHDLRGYRPGDTANTIHWKLSSKMDELIVREALVPENHTTFVVLSRVGTNDRGLEVLRWLSRKLIELEEPHVIVADSLYSVGSEEETDHALASLLSWPMREACGFDIGEARCVFIISGGEVRTL